LTSDLSTLAQDQGTRIRWETARANSCTAVGGWSSNTAANGKHWVSSIDRTTTYTMTCSGEGGSVTRSVTLQLDSNNEPANEAETPTLVLTSNLTSVDSGDSVTIRWESENTTECFAENNWSTNTAVTGKQYISSVANTTLFRMTCTGDGGTVTESVAVTVNETVIEVGTVELNWAAPTTNQDGSQLNDLAGYRIYHGSSSSKLNNVIEIDAGLTSYVINNIPFGTHYFSISAIDTNGNESSRSNIASKVVN